MNDKLVSTPPAECASPSPPCDACEAGSFCTFDPNGRADVPGYVMCPEILGRTNLASLPETVYCNYLSLPYYKSKYGACESFFFAPGGKRQSHAHAHTLLNSRCASRAQCTTLKRRLHRARVLHQATSPPAGTSCATSTAGATARAARSG